MIFAMMMMLVCVTAASAQQFSVRRDRNMAQIPDSMTMKVDSHIYKAGKCLSRSANYDLLSWGLTGVAVLSYSASFNSEKNEKSFRNIGISFAVAALAARFLSITYKSEAGYELRLSTGTVQVTF